MWTVWLFFLEVVQRNCNQLYLADQQFILKKSPALLQEMINVICQLIIMARSREGKKRNCIIKPSRYVSFVILHKVFGSCGKLNLWYLEMPKCTFALFTVRVLYFEIETLLLPSSALKSWVCVSCL